jgi:dephospho-CoA kinase
MANMASKSASDMNATIEHALAGKRLIGLTGNIATGKSTVRRTLQELGALTIDADEVAREVVAPGRPALAEIVRIFGANILLANGALDRRALAAIVFEDAAKLRMLEAIVHPAVRIEVAEKLAAAKRGDVAVLEAIKLLESGWRAHCAAIWVTTCSPEMQLQRLMESRGMSEAEARMRIDAQPPQAEKLAAADVVIDSDRPVAEMRAQIEREWRRLVGG